MHTLLSLVRSAPWLADSVQKWLHDESLQEHIGSMEKSLLAAINEREESAITDGMSLFTLLLEISTPCKLIHLQQPANCTYAQYKSLIYL